MNTLITRTRTFALCALAALAAFGSARFAQAADYEAYYLGALWLTGTPRGSDRNIVESDNRRFEIRSAKTGRDQVLEFGALFVVPINWLLVWEEFLSINIEIEANIAPNGLMGVFLYNWGKDQWQQVSNARYTKRDKVTSVSIADPSFISPEGYVAVDIFRSSRNLRSPFTFKIDQIRVWKETDL